MNTTSRNVDVSPRIVRAGCTQRAYQTIRIYARAAESRGKHAWSYSSAGSVLTLIPALFLLAILSFPFFVSSRCFQANKRTEERGNESRLASTHHVNRITRNWFQCIDLVRNLCCVHQTLIDLTNWVAFINDSCKTVNTVSSRCTEAVWSSNLICIRCLMCNCVSLIIIIHFIIEK